MTDIRVAEAKPWHCGRMVRVMRRTQREGLERLGVDVHLSVRQAFDASSWRRIILIDGELAVLGGVASTLLSPIGVVWMCISQQATHYPLAVTRTVATLIGEIMAGGKRELVTSVMNDDDAGQRFSAFLGFHVADVGPGQRAYSRAGRRALIDHLRKDPECRVPAMAGYVIRMGYHDEGWA